MPKSHRHGFPAQRHLHRSIRLPERNLIEESTAAKPSVLSAQQDKIVVIEVRKIKSVTSVRCAISLSHHNLVRIPPIRIDQDQGGFTLALYSRIVTG